MVWVLILCLKVPGLPLEAPDRVVGFGDSQVFHYIRLGFWEIGSELNHFLYSERGRLVTCRLGGGGPYVS